jgi:hypothetical protein
VVTSRPLIDKLLILNGYAHLPQRGEILVIAAIPTRQWA